MVSLHAAESEDAAEDAVWLKMLHLLVLIYEGVDYEVLGMPVSPLWMHVEDGKASRNLWMLVGQQGVSLVNELCEAGLLNCLRIVTKDIWSTAGFQVSVSGQKWLQQFPDSVKDQMNEFLMGPGEHRSEVLEVFIENMKVVLRAPTGYFRVSSITDCGQVSSAFDAFSR